MAPLTSFSWKLLDNGLSFVRYKINSFSNSWILTSGASAPETLVKNFINSLKNRFTVIIDEIEIIKEDVVFKIPKKLN